MQIADVRIAVYKMTNDVFESIGELTKIESIIWPKNYCGYATVQINAPITSENKELLKEGNVLWKYGGTDAAIIEVINKSVNENGMSYQIKGRTLESILDRRIIKSTYYAQNTVNSQIILDIINKHCINSGTDRKIPRLVYEPYESSGEETIVTFQNTGGNVYDTILSLAQESGLGFEIQFHPDLEVLLFRLYKGINRSINQTENDFVVFSSDTDDILTSSYTYNGTDEKNLALIAGEGEGSSRKYAQVVKPFTSGIRRGLDMKELFVDARDLQSTYNDDSGQQVTVSDLEYSKMLNQRGNEKLAENSIVESYECNLRTKGSQYQFGVDYFLGDTVSIVDRNLDITIDVTVTAVEEDIDDTYELVLTFGYGYPSLWTKLKQKFS